MGVTFQLLQLSDGSNDFNVPVPFIFAFKGQIPWCTKLGLQAIGEADKAILNHDKEIIEKAAHGEIAK